MKHIMKKSANKLKRGDKISIAGETAVILSIEFSDIGKHGKKKCRIEVLLENGKKIVIIRPDDFTFDVL